MTKTNFTKVEEALAEGMRRIELDKLNKEADTIQGKAPLTTEKQDQEKQRRLALKLALKWAWSKDKDFYTKQKIDRTEIKELLEKAELNEEEWAKITETLKRVEAFKTELESKQGIKNDSDMIEKQRKKHVTKRFNVNDKWVPLK
ncbi:MAG: hypothetical protein Q8K75_04130 [Chlamydiales bacterium]|nr:hypothetical protein [Chlamydiales bacterium]